ncbi:MAG TPA: 4Fe-4S dicluster domain-containing protein [Treponemataceae bacterium]|nr:4Fe-4S dicluster domain-containing protein [Treponemataceae bacterium]
MITFSEEKLQDFFAAIAKKQTLYLPVEQTDSEANFTKWEEGHEYSKAQNTVRSAKEFFFPKEEKLYEIKQNGKNLEVIDTRKPHPDFVVFGVKACDAKAFSIIDRVYLQQDPVDTYYKNRRDHGTIITMACNHIAPTCFCTLFGIDAANPSTAKDSKGNTFFTGDISAWIHDGSVWLEAKTKKGTALLNSLQDDFVNFDVDMNADAAPLEEFKSQIQILMQTQKFAHEDVTKFTKKNINPIFNSKLWEEMAESCLGCGACTYVCPTCMCYNIQDMDTGHGVKRFKTWDSCMYSDFTKMAEANPRTQQFQRFRQRFMHKLVYYPSDYEQTFACVGCGRCLQKCSTNNNIIKVIRMINADNTIEGDE